METQGSNAVIQKLRVGSISHVFVSGVIDETFSPASVSSDATGHVVVDLGRVERISSFGVRKWIEFAAQLPAGAQGLFLIHAPPIVVDQLNMVEGFAGVARLLSLLAPYRCPACNEDRLRLVDLAQDAEALAQGRAPEHACPVCNSALEFSDLPDEFFDFARRQQLGEVDPAVTRYLRTSMVSGPSQLSAPIKIIEGDVTHITLPSELRGDLNVRRLAAGLEGRVAFDFFHVAKVEPEAVPRLLQVVETASQGAEVFLCRVPPFVLSPLAQSGRPLKGKVSTLWLPFECRNCGGKHHQRVEASAYVGRARGAAQQEGQCIICGGAARPPSAQALLPLLASVPVTDGPIEDIEALEVRALSQYLFGGSSGSDSGTGKVQAVEGGSTTTSSNRLQVIRRLGQGGMAEVFLARQVGVKGFEKFVVMKKILSQFAESQEFVEMLFAEARANARLTHPNIVQTFDVGMMDGVAYITMEYVRGPDLKRLLKELAKKKLPLPMEHALRIVAETAAGLHYAHAYVDPSGQAHPMVHRDVSPHNVLVSLDGAIKLSDFGIAKVQGEDRTEAGVIKGKISYLSPEAACGRPLDARNDVFALGVVLFELLTGQMPFKRDHDAATLNAIVREPAPNPSQLNPAIPQDVSDIVLRALVKDPARRTPSAAAMREEIEAVMARHRMASSPFAVAQFFKEALPDKLAEFAPAAAGTGSSSSLKPATRVNEGGVTAVPAAPAPVDATRNSGDRSRTLQRPPQEPATAVVSHSALRPGEPAAARPATPAVPSQAVTRPATPAAGGAVARSPTSGSMPAVPPPVRAPVAAAGLTPAAASPAASRPTQPSQPALRPSGIHSRPTGAALPAVAPGARPAPQAPAPASAPVMAAPAPRAAPGRAGVSLPVLLGAAGGGVVLLALLLWGLLSGSSGVEVANLEPGEQLYIGGLRADPANVVLDSPGPVVVATALNGRLHRFGTATQRDRIDVLTLPEARPQPGLQATLKVTSEGEACRVEVADKMFEQPTPIAQQIEAAQELKLNVYCSSRKMLWSQWVMAVPGQEVEVLVRAD